MSLRTYAKTLSEDFISLLFPKICIHCGIALVHQEQHLCVSCRLALPKTEMHQVPDNPFMQKFAFEPKVKAVSVYLHFHKKGVAQSIIHELKYRGNTEIGELVGKWYAEDLRLSAWKMDCIIPVPLHKNKLERRGYNQSEHFAIGLSNGLNVPVITNLVKRTRWTSTQTKKTKVERWENIESVYSVVDSSFVQDKHILIVDDMLTTGATIGELVSLIAKHNPAAIYIATLAGGK